MKQNKFIDKVNGFAQKMASLTYTRVLRDAFAMVVPFLVLVGFVILLFLVVLSPGGILKNIVAQEVLQSSQILGSKIMNATMNILSLLLLISISYSLSVVRQVKNPIIAVMVAVSCRIALMPTSILMTIGGNSVDVPDIIPYSLMNANGMFLALITGILATELFIKLSRVEKLQIKMSGNIPAAVTASFNSLISIMLTIVIFASFSFLLKVATGLEINDIIVKVLQAPLVHFTTGLPGFLALCFCTNFLFFCGIHPGGIVNPVLEPPLYVAMQQNSEAFMAGLDIPNTIVLPFRDLYGHIGGTGSTLALIIAIIIVSRRKEHRNFAPVVLTPGVFNINEPVIFGFPIMFNPFMLIPFVFGPLVLFSVAYFATAVGLVHKIVAFVPWSMPPLINAWFASGGHISNVILQLVLIALQTLIYIPFLKLYEHSMENPATVEGK